MRATFNENAGLQPGVSVIRMNNACSQSLPHSAKSHKTRRGIGEEKEPVTYGGAYSDHRSAALALLNGNFRLNRKAGQFLGQLAVDPAPLSKAQADWLAKLLSRSGLPPVAEGGAR